MKVIRTIETTDGLYINLSDILKIMSKLAWATTCLTLFILHNTLLRGELFDGKQSIETDQSSA